MVVLWTRKTPPHQITTQYLWQWSWMRPHVTVIRIGYHHGDTVPGHAFCFFYMLPQLRTKRYTDNLSIILATTCTTQCTCSGSYHCVTTRNFLFLNDATMSCSLFEEIKGSADVSQMETQYKTFLYGPDLFNDTGSYNACVLLRIQEVYMCTFCNCESDVLFCFITYIDITYTLTMTWNRTWDYFEIWINNF